MNKFIPKRIESMSEYVPDTSCPSIKLDANECPFELPEDARRAISDAISAEIGSLNRYPDPEMKELLAAYAKYIGVKAELLIAGDGSDELINLIINTFLCDGGKIMLCLPDFSMYGFYSELAGVNTVIYNKKDGMRIDFKELTEIVKRENVKLVMFSNPCNPTGVLENREEILDFIGKTEALVVVDEAYMEFACDGHSVISEIENYDNLIVLKTVSKLGLAGLRCGFAMACTSLITALKKTKSPYNMNTLTQAAVAAAIRNFKGISENINRIKRGVIELYEGVIGLCELGGFSLEKSDTNFIYLRFAEASRAVTIQKELHARGISVRVMNGCLRVTSGTRVENEAFARELEDIIKSFKC